MTRTLAAGALAIAALSAGHAEAAPPQLEPYLDCLRTYLLVAEPVPRTLEQYVAATVNDVHRTATFAVCVVSGT